MAITANMTTHEGLSITDVYVRVTMLLLKNQKVFGS